MTDITKLFKTNVTTIRKYSNSPKDLNQELGLKARPTSKNQLTFNTSKEALNLVKNLTKLKETLIKNKAIYVQPNYLIDNQNQINDKEREQFEIETESIIRSCSETLKLLNEKAYSQSLTSQYKEHLENLFRILDKYLKDVCRIYTEQKAIQVQRTIEKKNFSQLYTPSAFDKKKRINSTYNPELDENKSTSESKEDENFSPDEIQIFEQENEYLIDTLLTTTQGIRNIQSQVVEIARLQEIFVEKILDQDSTINVIQTTSVNTNENIKMGNESIQEAMKNNAALRIWILFIVIVLSFTLLFLDWYND